MTKNLLIILLSAVILFGCKGKNGTDLSDEFEIPDSIMNSGKLELSESAVGDIIENVSSPVEMAALIKSLGVPFSRDYLATTDNVDRYTTTFQKAIGLGIFGADLGYLNMYSKTSLVLEYIKEIKDLSNDLRVGQFFDFNTLKRLATNNENLDSLMYISVQNFNQMDRYLRENGRSNVSSLIIAGMWIESMFLVGEVARINPEKLNEKIGEQKIILKSLMLILKNYESDPKFKLLSKEFEEINNMYDEVTITVEKGDPEAVEVDGMLVIQQNDKQIVDISDELVLDIINKIKETRNKIINL